MPHKVIKKSLNSKYEHVYENYVQNNYSVISSVLTIYIASVDKCLLAK